MTDIVIELVENTFSQEAVSLGRSTLLLKTVRDKLFKFLLPGVLMCFKWADMSAKLKISYNCVIVFSKQFLKCFQIVLECSKFILSEMDYCFDSYQ